MFGRSTAHHDDVLDKYNKVNYRVVPGKEGRKPRDRGQAQSMGGINMNESGF